MSITSTPSGAAGHRGFFTPSHSFHNAIHAELPTALMMLARSTVNAAQGRNFFCGVNWIFDDPITVSNASR